MASCATRFPALILLLPLLAFGQAGPPAPDEPPVGALPVAETEPAATVPASPVEAATPSETGPAAEEGRASWYGRRFAGRRTACGQVFDPKGLTIAHPTLACGTRVRVTNLSNGRSVEAEVTDRGPFTAGRIADLSRAVARELRFGGRGTLTVRLEVLDGVPERAE